jgi:tRNA threonylcarbamoyl adenosine modification protein (Sua5/YciO/YrdC/YwlC family)
VTARIVADDDAGRALAVEALEAGRLVALPTDTVYGVAVALRAPGGIERLFAAKGRPPEKGVVLLIADHRQADDVAEPNASFHVLAAAFWPGGLTLVARRRGDVELPIALTGGAATVGLRLPDHDAPRALAAALGPLPVSSANRSGEPEAVDAAGVLAALGDATDLAIVLDGGPARLGAPSSVVDCSVEPPRLLRAGAIPAAALSAALADADLPALATG